MPESHAPLSVYTHYLVHRPSDTGSSVRQSYIDYIFYTFKCFFQSLKFSS
uniref:Uncharacterized protein n=1 Tax=Anguilla anguilla TaxID=7936 RepID=A0A0E9W5X0_ANGAN